MSRNCSEAATAVKVVRHENQMDMVTLSDTECLVDTAVGRGKLLGVNGFCLGHIRGVGSED